MNISLSYLKHLLCLQEPKILNVTNRNNKNEHKAEAEIMGTRTAANSLVKRTAFSSAINIFPNEVATPPEIINHNETAQKSSIRPYSEIPGPKELPLIGNSWRFAPVIGKSFSCLLCSKTKNRACGLENEINKHKTSEFLVTIWLSTLSVRIAFSLNQWDFKF